MISDERKASVIDDARIIELANQYRDVLPAYRNSDEAVIAFARAVLAESAEPYRQDAERYRWLRENDGGSDVIINWNVGHDWISSEDLDAAIDAALVADQQEQKK